MFRLSRSNVIMVINYNILLYKLHSIPFNYSKDTLGQENYGYTAESAHRSRNIHPVLRYYAKTFKGKLIRVNYGINVLFVFHP